MIRRAAPYAVAATIGSFVGTLVGTAFGVSLATLVMKDQKNRDVVVNYQSPDSPESDGLQPQDAVLEDVHLATPPPQ